MTEQEEIELDYYIGMCSDLVPYSDPHYQERVVAMAKSVMEAENNPDPSLVSLCEEHDRLLENMGRIILILQKIRLKIQINSIVMFNRASKTRTLCYHRKESLNCSKASRPS